MAVPNVRILKILVFLNPEMYYEFQSELRAIKNLDIMVLTM